MAENKALVIVNKLNEKMNKFSNLKFGFYLEDTEKDNEYILSGTVESISSNTNLNKTIIDLIINKTINQLSVYLEDIDNITDRMLDHLIEDICIELLFEINLDEVESYNEIYDFIRQLEEISNKTYEMEKINTGILILKDCLNVEEQLKHLNTEFIPIDSLYSVEDIIKKEKPLIKLVDGKSLVYVANRNFKIIGFARKIIGEKSIEEEIVNLFTDKLYYNSRCLTIMHVIEILKTQFSSLLKSNNPKIRELELKWNEDQSNVTDFREILKAIGDITDELRGDLINDLSIQLDKLTPNLANNDMMYIRISNAEVQWYNNNNFMLSLKNNKWIIKHYILLSSFLFNNLFISQVIQYFDSDSLKLIEFINDAIDKIIKLIELLKKMSEKNIGGLFVILNYKDNIKDSNYKIPKGLVKTKNTEEFYKKVINSVDDEKKFMSIVRLDNYLLELIAGVDGATILDPNLNVISYGEIINNSSKATKISYGARTNAAISASKYGLAIKVSEDGDIEIYKNGECIYKI